MVNDKIGANTEQNEVQLAFGCKDLDVSEGGASSLLCATLPVEKVRRAVQR